jgi:hypothetical protein
MMRWICLAVYVFAALLILGSPLSFLADYLNFEATVVSMLMGVGMLVLAGFELPRL